MDAPVLAKIVVEERQWLCPEYSLVYSLAKSFKMFSIELTRLQLTIDDRKRFKTDHVCLLPINFTNSIFAKKIPF